MSGVKKRNYTIDIIRFFTSLFVVFHHCPFPGFIGEAIAHYAHYSVPFFLMVSGWYSYYPDSSTAVERNKKKLLDTLKLIGSFALLYCVMNTLSDYFNGEPLYTWVLKSVDPRSLIYFVVFNRALFFGSTGYYAFMLVYVHIIFHVLLKRSWVDKAYYAIPVLLTVNMLVGAFTDLPWFCCGNFLMMGLPFVLLGHWMRKNSDKLLAVSKTKWTVVLALGILINTIEFYFRHDAYCTFGASLIGFAAVPLSLKSDLVVRNQKLMGIMQRYSMYIFVLHCGVMEVMKAFFNARQIDVPAAVFPMIVFTVTMVICAGWDYLAVGRKQRKKASATNA